jgi:hypothetical protein
VTRYSTLKLLLLLATATAIPATLARDWKALEEDDLHDRSNPAVGILQEPEEALSVLAPDSAGNKVNWVEAIRQGQIKPRASLYGDNPVRQTSGCPAKCVMKHCSGRCVTVTPSAWREFSKESSAVCATGPCLFL